MPPHQWGDVCVDDAALTDEQMVILLARCDEGVLGALYDRHASRVMGMALAVLHDVAAAEEVTQEVFLKLWRKPESFDASRGRFMSWVLALTRNQAIDRLRSDHGLAAAEHNVELSDDLPGASDPEEEAWITERRQTVRTALRQLPDAQRQVIALAYFSGLSQSEIAQRLGEPLGTVKTRTHLAMQKLRASLAALGLELEDHDLQSG
jgi:RNA polymerase sigma-70 factor, ECF subfamily